MTRLSGSEALPSRSDTAIWPLTPMGAADLDEVVAIEDAAYSHPWSRGNFADSLHSNYLCRLLRDPADGSLVGYFLMMIALDDAHLLNITVRPAAQRRGIGAMLLERAIELARECRAAILLLEVRPSNLPAIALYERRGFQRIGTRRNYYPAVGQTREDAIVMRLPL
ncbi:MAG: ribosomal protein S18-alanine N-acetyltransferase [Burkholderiaceae bacterium]